MGNEHLGPLSGEILEIDQALDRSNAKISLASKDYRLQAVVEAVALSENNPPDYHFIGELLDELEEEYGLSVIELVEAYRKCEQRYESAQMETIDDEA